MSNLIIEDIKAQLRDKNPVVRLIVVNVAVFLLVSVFAIFNALGVMSFIFIFFKNNLSMPLSITGVLFKPWTVITYMFIHFDVFHLFWNMISLFWFGKILSDYTSTNKIIPLYLLGGIAGALFTIVVYTLIPSLAFNYGFPLVGASAGITAIIVAVATLVPHVKLNLMFIGPVKLVYLALFIVFLDVLNLASRSDIGGSLSHIGGAIMGYLFIVQYKKGSDWSIAVNALLDKLNGVFKTSSKSKLKKVYSRPVSDEHYNANRAATQQQIDAILDKISKSGYESLSAKEKEQLFKASNK